MTRLNEVFPETKVYVKLMSFYSPNQIYSLIDRVFPFLFFLLFITMPFAKTISGPVYVTCIILFVVRILSRQEYQTEANQYYVAVLFYLAVIGLSMIYTPDVLEGPGFFKQQCIVIIGVMLIEKVSSSEAVRRYLYSFIAGGSILALISLFQGLHLNVTRPPTIWYSVHGGNLLLMSLAVTTALLVSESSNILRIVNFTLFFFRRVHCT